MNLLEVAVASYKEKVTFGLELFGNIEKAIEFANGQSTAGIKAKSIALQEMGY